MAKGTLICHGQMEVVASQKNSVIVTGNFKFATRADILPILQNTEPNPTKLWELLARIADNIKLPEQGTLFEDADE
jgi:hypothetical protein